MAVSILGSFTNTEQYNMDGFWQIQNQYLVQFQNVSLPGGGFSLQDCTELYLLLKKFCDDRHLQNIQIAEIGCWTGTSSLVLGSVAEKYQGKVICIDWFKGSTDTPLFTPSKHFNVRRIFEDNLKQFNQGKFIQLIEASSEEAVKQFTDGSLDIIFLDGDHRYAGIRQDIDMWLPKLKQGGLLCGHDCELTLDNGLETLYDYSKDMDILTNIHMGVCRAVTELGGRKVTPYPKFTAEESRKSVIWYYIKP